VAKNDRGSISNKLVRRKLIWRACFDARGRTRRDLVGNTDDQGTHLIVSVLRESRPGFRRLNPPGGQVRILSYTVIDFGGFCLRSL
jgi:hypothetical protein